MSDQPTPHVYAAIVAVTANLGRVGIDKSRTNAQQGYKFRGIDDVYNALSAALSAAKLCVLPRVLERSVVERATRNGGALSYVTVRVEFDLVSAVDGSRHVVTTYGEAMDSADKATNKAMSAAYKYAAMQAFCIPTEGDNDADASTHDVVATAPAARTPVRAKGAASPGDDEVAKLQAVIYMRAKDVISKNKSEVQDWIEATLGRNLETQTRQTKAGAITERTIKHLDKSACLDVLEALEARAKASKGDGDPAAAAALADTRGAE